MIVLGESPCTWCIIYNNIFVRWSDENIIIHIIYNEILHAMRKACFLFLFFIISSSEFSFYYRSSCIYVHTHTNYTRSYIVVVLFFLARTTSCFIYNTYICCLLYITYYYLITLYFTYNCCSSRAFFFSYFMNHKIINYFVYDIINIYL